MSKYSSGFSVRGAGFQLRLLRWTRGLWGGVIWCVLAGAAAGDMLVDFDELNQWTATEERGSYFNGDRGTGTNANGWQSGGVHFGNRYTADWGGFWQGFAYSNIDDTETAGFTNQYAAITGSGWGGQGNYAVAYAGSETFWDFQSTARLESVRVTNTTYATLAMEHGDAFSKKFGGESGNDPDFFKLTFVGYSQAAGQGSETGRVDFYLADYRFDDDSQDYVVRDWVEVDLQGLGWARSVRLEFDGSDQGSFGLNTPAYAALDQLRWVAVPEPNSGTFFGALLVLTAGTWRRHRRSLPTTGIH